MADDDGKDAWDAFLERLDDAAKLTGIDPDIHLKLTVPKRVLEVAVPVKMAKGASASIRPWTPARSRPWRPP